MFRFGLSTFLNQEKYQLVAFIAITYGVLLFLSGWVLGKKHGINSLKFDIGLGFHLAGFLSWTLISLFWFLLGFNSPKESIDSLYYAILIWGVFLVIHIIIFLILRRNTIKGIHKSEIFD
jgi:hypothetical protein